jgi:acyl carrier protein
MSIEIENAVRSILVDNFKVKPEDVELERTFKEIGLDSLDIVSFVMALEDRFDIDIPESDLQGVERLNQALEVIVRKVAANA